MNYKPKIKQILFVPCDKSEKNQKFLKGFLKSLEKFHPDLEVRVFDNPNPMDKDFWYRAKPIIASDLFKEGYEMVIGADCDQVVLGSLIDIVNDSENYDVGVVLNDPTYPIQVWDIIHPRIYNNGLVVMKNPAFVEHWKRLCFSPHFPNYQYREQDLLTLLCSDYFNYNVKILDTAKKVYGEVLKPRWIDAKINDDDEWNVKVCIDDTQLCIAHWGGGSGDPTKGNYRLKFKPEIADHIERLIK